MMKYILFFFCTLIVSYITYQMFNFFDLTTFVSNPQSKDHPQPSFSQMMKNKELFASLEKVTHKMNENRQQGPSTIIDQESPYKEIPHDLRNFLEEQDQTKVLLELTQAIKTISSNDSSTIKMANLLNRINTREDKEHYISILFKGIDQFSKEGKDDLVLPLASALVYFPEAREDLGEFVEEGLNRAIKAEGNQHGSREELIQMFEIYFLCNPNHMEKVKGKAVDLINAQANSREQNDLKNFLKTRFPALNLKEDSL